VAGGEGGRAGHARGGTGLLARHELRHVQIGGRALADLLARGGLVQVRSHAAVRQAHVAQQALGVVAQRHGQLAQVVRQLAALALDLASGRVRLGDDRAGLIACIRAPLLGLGLGVGTPAGQLLLQQGRGLCARGLQDLDGFGLGYLDAVLGRALGLGDALARALLGVLAQLGRRALGGLDDALHAARCLLGLHLRIVDRSAGTADARGLGRKCGKSVLADGPRLGDDRPMSASAKPREIVIVVYPGVQSLDLTGPLEVFAGAQQLLDAARRSGAGAERAAGDGCDTPATAERRGYRVSVLSRDGAPLRTSSGLRLTPDGALADAPARIDTLLLAGGSGCAQAAADSVLLDWLARGAPRARRTASVCTGAFVLAAAGLLDGRRATTHWASAAELARRYPRIEVDPEPIFVRDGSVWTSAGVTAGMDLALALVEEDLDRETALTIARHLVLFLRRPGNQAQFSAALLAQQPEREPLREVQRFAVENPGAELSVEAMAERAHLSPRHFARSFRAEVGVTPARYVGRVRLEAARRRLEDTPEPVGAVALACGFGTAETMRRVFLRTLGVAPAEYRRRFQSRRAAA
jgi:transcriptional regulator GlxA family with amidase domain